MQNVQKHAKVLDKGSSQIFVIKMLSQARSNSCQPGYVVSNLLDSLNLFIQEVIKVVGHVLVPALPRQFMQVNDRLVHRLLKFKSSPHGLQAGAPFIAFWFLDVLQHNATSSLVLKLHQFLGMILLFISGFLEELVEPRQCDIVPVEVKGHGSVDVVSVQLQIDLLVDPGLALRGVVLTASRSGRHL